MATNKMAKLVNASAALPTTVRVAVISKIFGRIVPMVGTAGIRYEHISADKVVCSMQNKRPIQNHINGLHAVAVALLAETATGFVTAMNIPDDRIVLIKSLKLDYLRVGKGSMTATATLSLTARQFIAEHPKGELVIPVVIRDESDRPPVECHMVWAWVSKDRIKK